MTATPLSAAGPTTEAGRRLRALLEEVGIRDPERGLIVDAENEARAKAELERDQQERFKWRANERLDAERQARADERRRLREGIEAELALLPTDLEKLDRFDAGAAASYTWCLALLADDPEPGA